MINKYIQENYTTILNKVKGVTKNHHLTQDLFNDILLKFLEKGEDYTNQVLQDDKVDHYLVRMAHIQFNSSTSPFYTQYRKQAIKSSDIDEWDIEIEDEVEIHTDKKEMVKDVKIYIGKLPHYNRTLAEKHFLEGKSQREMSKMYNINRIHITKDINTIKSNIQRTFNKQDYGTH